MGFVVGNVVGPGVGILVGELVGSVEGDVEGVVVGEIVGFDSKIELTCNHATILCKEFFQVHFQLFCLFPAIFSNLRVV